MKLVHIGGAKGVGKTTVLKYLEADATITNPIRIIECSLQLKILGKTAFGNDWENLNDEQRAEMRRSLHTFICNLPYDAVLLDSHYAEVRDNKIRAWLPEEYKRSVGLHIVIEASLEDILARRLNDPVKKRRIDLNSIAEEVRAEIKTAMAIAKETNKKLYVITNHNSHNTAAELVSLLRQEMVIT